MIQLFILFNVNKDIFYIQIYCIYVNILYTDILFYKEHKNAILLALTFIILKCTKQEIWFTLLEECEVQLTLKRHILKYTVYH